MPDTRSSLWEFGRKGPVTSFWEAENKYLRLADDAKRKAELDQWHPDSPMRALLSARFQSYSDQSNNIQGRSFKYGSAFDLNANQKMIDKQVQQSQEFRKQVIDPLVSKLRSPDYTQVLNTDTESTVEEGYRQGYISKNTRDNLVNQISQKHLQLSKKKATDDLGNTVPAASLRSGRNVYGSQGEAKAARDAATEDISTALAKEQQKATRTPQGLVEAGEMAKAGGGMVLGAVSKLNETVNPVNWAMRAMGQIDSMEDQEAAYRKQLEKSGEDPDAFFEAFFGGGAGALQAVSKPAVIGGNMGKKVMAPALGQSQAEAGRIYDELGINQWYENLTGDPTNLDRQVSRIAAMNIVEQAPMAGANLVGMQLVGNAITKALMPVIKTSTQLNITRMGGMLAPTAVGAVGAGMGNAPGSTGEMLQNIASPLEWARKSNLPGKEYELEQEINQMEGFAAQRLAMTAGMFGGGANQFYRDAGKLFKLSRDLGKLSVFGRVAKVNPASVEGQRMLQEYYQLQSGVSADAAFGLTNIFDPVARQIGSNYSENVLAPTVSEWLSTAFLTGVAVRPAKGIQGFLANNLSRGVDIDSQAKFYAQDIVDQGSYHSTGVNARFKKLAGGNDANTQDLQKVTSLVYETAAQEFVNQDKNAQTFKSLDSIFFDILNGKSDSSVAIDQTIREMRARGDNSQLAYNSPLKTLTVNPSLFPVTPKARRQAVNSLAKMIKPSIALQYDMAAKGVYADSDGEQEVADPAKQYYGVLRGNVDGENEYIVYNKYFSDATLHRGDEGLDDVQIISAIDLNKQRAQARVETVATGVTKMLREFNSRQNLWLRDGVYKSIGGIRTDGTIIVKTKKSGADADVSYSYMSFNDVQRELSRENKPLLRVINDLYERSNLNRDTANSDPLPRVEKSDNFPVDVLVATGETVNGRLIGTTGLTLPTGVYQLADGSVIFGATPESGAKVQSVFDETSINSSPELVVSSVLRQAEAFTKNGTGYIDVDVLGKGIPSRVEISPDLLDTVKSILEMEGDDASKAQAIMQKVVSDIAGTHVTGDKALRYDPETKQFVADVELKPGDRVVFKTDETGLRDVVEGVIVDAGNGIGTVKLKDNPEGPAYTLSADRFALSDGFIPDDVLNSKLASMSERGIDGYERPVAITSADEEAIEMYLAHTANIDVGTKIGSSTAEDLYSNVHDAIVNTRATPAGIQRGLLEWAMRNNVEDVQDTLAQVISTLSTPGKEVDIATFRKAMSVYSNVEFNELLYRVMSVHQSIDPKYGTLFSAGKKLPQFGTIAKRSEALQVARRMNLLMLTATNRADGDLFKRALTSLGYDPRGVEESKVISLAKKLRGIAPHVFYYVQDMWHVDKLSASSHAAQATLGRAITAISDPAIRAQVINDQFIPDSSLDFWKSKDKFDKAVRDIRGLLSETRTETYDNGTTERYPMSEILYARLRDTGLEFLFHMAKEPVQRNVRKVIQSNMDAASQWHRDSVSYMYETYLPDVAIETINAKIISGTFMSDSGAEGEQTNNISFAPELLALGDKLVDNIHSDIRLTDDQKQSALDKVNQINALLDGLSEQEIERLRLYDSGSEKRLRLFSDVEVDGDIRKDQPANLRVASADQQYRESLARAAKESGMTMSEAQLRAHEVYVSIFKSNAIKMFGGQLNLRNVVDSIESSAEYIRLKTIIDDINSQYKPDEDVKRAALDALDTYVVDAFNTRLQLVRDTLSLLTTLQEPVIRPASQSELNDAMANLMSGIESEEDSKYIVNDDGTVMVRGTTPLGEAVEDVFSALNVLQARLSGRDQLTSSTSLDAPDSEDGPTFDSVVSTDETTFLQNRIKDSVERLASLSGEDATRLQAEIDADRVRLQIATNDAHRSSTSFGRRQTDYNAFEAAINRVAGALDSLSPDAISTDTMMLVYGKFVSLLPSSSEISNDIKNDLTVRYASQNILLEDAVRRIRVSGVTSEAISQASLSDVIKLQSGDLRPEVFANQYGISVNVATMIATVDAYNPRQDVAPTIVTDGDLIFADESLVPDDIKRFVGTSPDIVHELVSSSGPDAFDGMIKSPDGKIVAYSAQNFEGLRILLRSMLAKSFSDADAQHAMELISRTGSELDKAVNDAYVSPLYIADKIDAVGGKFNNLSIDDDVANFIDIYLKKAMRKYSTVRRDSPEFKAAEAIVVALKNPPDIKQFAGRSVSEYFDAFAQDIVTRQVDLYGVTPEDASTFSQALLKDLSPDTNRSLTRQSYTLRDLGAEPIASTNPDPAYSARRILAALKQQGIPMREYSASVYPLVEYASIQDAHRNLRLDYVPNLITQISPGVARQLSSLYTTMIDGFVPTPENQATYDQLSVIRDMYLTHSESGGDLIERRSQISKAAETDAIQEYADNLAAVYDINALSYARDQLTIKLSTNHSREFKDEVAEALSIVGVNSNVVNELMQPHVNVNVFLNSSQVTREQANYAITYLTAKYKKDYYTKHNSVLLTNQELLDETGATATRVTTDKRDVFGFTQSLAHNQGRAVKSLIFVGSKKNNPYRTALTLTHEMFHPLFTGMADSTQIDFLSSITSRGTLMSQSMTDTLSDIARSISDSKTSVAEQVKGGSSEVQATLDKFSNPELALALQIKVASEAMNSGVATTLESALKPLAGITFRGEDLSQGWISHGHEKFVTSMMNFITDYTVVQSRNAAASIDSGTLAVFQQMRSTLRYVMRQIHYQHPMDVIYDETGAPHASWYMPVPVQRYEMPRVQVNQDFIWGRASAEKSPFNRVINFAQLQQGNYLRISVPNNENTHSSVISPTQLFRSIKSVQASDIEFGGSPYMFGFKHSVGEQQIMLPFDSSELRQHLLANPDDVRILRVVPFKNRAGTRVIDENSKPSREYMGRVVDMIAKTSSRNATEARLIGYEPSYFDGNSMWVKGDTDNDGWFVPRLRANTEDPKAYKYAIAGQHEYAYVVEAPVGVMIGEKYFKTNVRFMVGEQAFTEQNRSTYDPVLVGYTQEFDPKFSALIYDTHRKMNTVLYDAIGNVRWKKQLDLERRLLSNDASSFTLRTETPIGQALESYFGSSEYKAVNATRMSMQPQIIDGANQFDALLDQIVASQYTVTTPDGETLPTEAGEKFVARLDNAVTNLLSPYITNNGLFRHDRSQAVQTNSWLIENGSPEQEALFTVFQAMVGETGDVNILRDKMIGAYSELNTRGDIRQDRRSRIDGIMAKYDIPTMVTLSDGREYQTTDLFQNLLRNEQLAISNIDSMSIATRADQFYKNIIEPIITSETGDLPSTIDLQQSKPISAAYVLDTLMNVIYGNQVVNKANFLNRLAVSVDPADYGDIDTDPDAAIAHQNAIHGRNSAFAEFISVAHALDAQSREMGRALYAWKDWSLVGDKSFPMDSVVIIKDKEGAMFRVNLNDPTKFVESAAYDFGRDTITDSSPFSRLMNLYNPDKKPPRMTAQSEKSSFNREVGDIGLTAAEYSDLITSPTDSIDIVRPFGIDNNNDVPGVNIFRVSRQSLERGGKRSYAYDPSESMTVTALSHGYKSQYVKDDGTVYNNQRLQTQAINHLMRLSFANNPDAKPESIRNAANTVIIPREVMIAKLLVARALINNDTDVPVNWKRNNALKSATYMRLAGPQQTAYIDGELDSANVHHNRRRTWMSDGADNEADLDSMSELERSYFDLPIKPTPEQMQDPDVASQYKNTQFTWALERAHAVDTPRDVIVKRESDPNMNHVGISVKGRDIYISIPDADYDYATRTMFSASGPTGPHGPLSALSGLPAGAMTTLPGGSNLFSKRGGTFALGAYHEINSLLKAAVLSVDFARPMLQNFRLANITNPKNFAAQFWGLSGLLPNMWWFTGGKARPLTASGKLAAFTFAHRPDLAWGDKQYHAKMNNYIFKYGTKGNRLNYGAIPLLRDREVMRSYNISDLNQYGLKTTYGDWYDMYNQMKLTDPTLLPTELAIQPTQAENIGEGLLARRLLPFVNQFERAGAMSTDIIRVKSFLEFATFIDNKIEMKPYEKEMAKRDYATFVNVLTGTPSGVNPLLGDTHREFNSHFRTIYTSPNWFNSLMMQTYFPAAVKYMVAEGVNTVSRTATRGIEPFGVGYDVMDASAEAKWFKTMRTKPVLFQHIVNGASTMGAIAMLGQAFQALGMYMERRQLHELYEKDYVDFVDWRRIMAPIYNEKGVRIDDKLRFDNKQWWNPMDSKNNFGIVRSANTLEWSLPQSATILKRTLTSPLLAAANEPSLSTEDKALKFANELWKANFANRLGPVIQGAKMMYTGRTYTDYPAFQKHPGLLHYVKLQDRMDKLNQDRHNAQVSGNTALVNHIDLELKKLMPVKMQPLTSLYLSRLAKLNPRGLSRANIALTQNLSIQAALQDLEQAAWSESLILKNRANVSGDYSAYAIPAFLRPFGFEAKFNDYYTMDLLTKGQVAGISGKQFNYLNRSQKYVYPNAANMVSKYGWSSLLEGVPDSGGYGDVPAFNPREPMLGMPDAKVVRDSTVRPEMMQEVIKRQPKPTIKLPGDLIVPRTLR